MRDKWAVKGMLLVLTSWLGALPAWSTCEVPPDLALERPDPEGTPTSVSIGLFLIDLHSINDSDQLYRADILVSASWQDPRLVSTDPSTSLFGCRVPLDAVWNPRLAIVNEYSIRRVFDKTVLIAADGRVEYLQRLQGEFTSRLDLREFPFDRHELHVDFGAIGYSPDQVEITVETGRGLIGELTIADWELGEIYAKVEPLYIKPRDWHVAAASFRIPVWRRVGFYSLKTFLPLTLIVCMSWAVFWIKPGMLPPQIGVATSAVLTLIAFQFSLGYMLPRLSYLTRADRFLIGATLLVFMAFGEALWTSYLATQDQETRALRIDSLSRVIFPLVFMVLLLVAFVI